MWHPVPRVNTWAASSSGAGKTVTTTRRGSGIRASWISHPIRQVPYNVYRELMELMRDEGLHERALHYLGLLTECNRRIDPAMAELDDKMNRAAILSDMGREAEAVRLLRELQADTAYMREPVNCQLVNLNLHNLERATSALHAAWRSISLYGDRADILPKVYFYMEEEAMEARDCMAARRWSDSLAAMLPEFGPGEFRVKSLKGIAGRVRCAARLRRRRRPTVSMRWQPTRCAR